MSKIKAVDKVRKEQRKTVVEGDVDGYSALFAAVLESAAKRADVVQYMLVLLGDLLESVYSPPCYSFVASLSATLLLRNP